MELIGSGFDADVRYSTLGVSELCVECGALNLEFLDDIEGATVFIGPQGGGAYNAARRWT